MNWICEKCQELFGSDLPNVPHFTVKWARIEGRIAEERRVIPCGGILRWREPYPQHAELLQIFP